MAKKTLALLLSAAMITSMMTACGGSEDKKEDAKDTATSEDVKDDGADEKEEGSGEEVVLQVFDAHAYGLDQYAEMVEAFEKEHPGVKIEVRMLQMIPILYYSLE